MVVDAVTERPDVFPGVLLMCPVMPDPDPEFLVLLTVDFDQAIELFLDLCLPEAAHRDVASIRRWAHSVLHQSCPDNAVQLMHALKPRQPINDYNPIGTPTAIVIGGDDPMSDTTHLDSWTQLFTNATATVLPQVGHIAAFTAPDAVNAAFSDLVQRLTTEPGLRSSR